MPNNCTSKSFWFALCLSLFLFARCTGGGGGGEAGIGSGGEPRIGNIETAAKPKVDGEAVQGRTERAFFKTRSAHSASVVLTEGAGKKTQKLEIDNGVASAPTDVNPALVHLSLDEKILTLENEPGLYEYQNLTVAQVTSGTPIPYAAIEAYCIGVEAAGYAEFRVERNGGAYDFVGIGPGVRDIIGGTGQISKSISGGMTHYSKVGFGFLIVDPAHENPNVPTFFVSVFSGAPSPWRELYNVFCHINSLPQSGSFTVTKEATVANSLVEPGTVWSDLGFISSYNKKQDDIYFTEVEMIGGQTSQTLKVSGYGFSLPVDAIISGVSLTLRARSLGCSQTLVQLQDGTNGLSQNKASSHTWTSSFNNYTYGGVNDSWNLALTPAKMNTGFYVNVQVNSGTCSINKADLTVHYSIP